MRRRFGLFFLSPSIFALMNGREFHDFIGMHCVQCLLLQVFLGILRHGLLVLLDIGHQVITVRLTVVLQTDLKSMSLPENNRATASLLNRNNATCSSLLCFRQERHTVNFRGSHCAGHLLCGGKRVKSGLLTFQRGDHPHWSGAQSQKSPGPTWDSRAAKDRPRW
jgi:hypothetical protein